MFRSVVSRWAERRDARAQWPLVTYVPDLRTAMTEAKRAAGEKNVLVHGPSPIF